MTGSSRSRLRLLMAHAAPPLVFSTNGATPLELQLCSLSTTRMGRPPRIPCEKNVVSRRNTLVGPRMPQSYHVHGGERLVRPAVIRQDDIEALENRGCNSDAFICGKWTAETASRTSIPGVIFYSVPLVATSEQDRTLTERTEGDIFPVIL